MSLSIESLVVEADRCVACGLCLPHCPTYRKTGSEADSPRGRIQLMRAVAQEVLPNNDRFKEHIDLCLSCRSCEAACPNSVNYGALVDTSRTLHIPKRNNWYTLAKTLVRNRPLQYVLNAGIWLLQTTKLDTFLKSAMPAAKRLPAVSMPTFWKNLYPATATKQGEVSLFLGCATNTLDNQTIHASIYVLNKLGFDAYIPKAQTCCGSIARQMGDADEAIKLVAQNQASFNPAMPVISLASGCGAGLKDYMPQHKVQDISAFLLGCDWSQASIQPLPQRVFVQDPCTLRNVLKSHQAVYSLLKKIPEADIQPLPGNAQCCGGAGAYMLSQDAMANQLRQDKITAIQRNQVAILATSNIGCSLHIAAALKQSNLDVAVIHPVQLLAQQMGWLNA